jgi:hypothetical protein
MLVAGPGPTPAGAPIRPMQRSTAADNQVGIAREVGLVGRAGQSGVGPGLALSWGWTVHVHKAP